MQPSAASRQLQQRRSPPSKSRWVLSLARHDVLKCRHLILLAIIIVATARYWPQFGLLGRLSLRKRLAPPDSRRIDELDRDFRFDMFFVTVSQIN